VTCYRCGKTFPLVLMQPVSIEYLEPDEAESVDTETVWLCPDCARECG